MKDTQTQESYKSSFKDVWSQVASDELGELPQSEISYSQLSVDGQNIILKDAQRTLKNQSDILEYFQKLAHPNGICFKGIWEIEEENIYSGYFKLGSKALIIARASTAMSNTKSGATRAFGFAGKLFPTLDENKVSDEYSANFFLIDDLGGTDAEYYRDIALTNEPSVSFTFEVFKNMFYAMKVSGAFSDADKNPAIRQLYEISELAQTGTKKTITPKWMKIELQSTTKDKEDFRDELKIDADEELVFNIFVASKKIDEKRDWQKVGTIKLDSSVVSLSCDHRLHFHHPLWRDDL